MDHVEPVADLRGLRDVGVGPLAVGLLPQSAVCAAVAEGLDARGVGHVQVEQTRCCWGWLMSMKNGEGGADTHFAGECEATTMSLYYTLTGR